MIKKLNKLYSDLINTGHSRSEIIADLFKFTKGGALKGFACSGIKCQCGSNKHHVIQTTQLNDKKLRRYVCLECDHVFDTIELVECRYRAEKVVDVRGK